MTLEPYTPVNDAKLAALEADAAEHRMAIRDGHDPLAEREAEAAANIVAADPVTIAETFEQAALSYIAANKPGWKNAKHAAQWTATLETYVYPIIGDKPTHEITLDDVKRVLLQTHERKRQKATLWTGARETAKRVRNRIELVIKASKVRGQGDNRSPERQALWRNHVNPADAQSLRLDGLNGKQIKTHFKAMDWRDVPAFMAELLRKPDYSARALALTILCATRSNETFNATWAEFDLDRALWTIPGERMKAGNEHAVPLSSAAVSVLRTVPRVKGNPYVFPGTKRERPLSNMAMLEMLRGMRPGKGFTVHGFRSAFRDWISETTLHPDTVAEQALAHTIDDKTVKAYLRGNLFERRKALMQQWADYLTMDESAYAATWEKLIAR
jgi:integrase